MYPQTAQLRQHGAYVLALSSEHHPLPLGLLALRPRLVPGVTELVQTCQRHHVALHVLASGDQIAVQTLARRAAISLLECDNALNAIHDKQQEGLLVAFVSDNAGAAAAFAACDLAIGLAGPRYRLSARADVLAPDLAAVAAIVEAGARRESTVRDSVGLSVLANFFGLLWGVRGRPGLEQASRAVYITALGALADGWLRLRGGERARSVSAHFVDPQPER
jgi:cation-transporting P-type ATPase I